MLTNDGAAEVVTADTTMTELAGISTHSLESFDNGCKASHILVLDKRHSGFIVAIGDADGDGQSEIITGVLSLMALDGTHS